ncbi:hypothetical protein G3576_04365 [Roseomonas stagni]|uniref:Uncharacterized protein n=1 Tax=Falsiroseomonas algicola TaxID=2716930 RepID=A0A6M1LGF4_9PROT|nr:hypothetical protein [Falsiroseomonas algicola]NGM19237.1 hypothetical protein [Falsiroseomonas algicola]
MFVQERDGSLDATPDLELLHALLRQTPLVTRNDDGSRTYVFDLVEPGSASQDLEFANRMLSLESLKACSLALGRTARAMGLPLTAALADSAEVVAEAELRSLMPAPRQRMQA